jgi:glutaredoxin
LVVVIYSKPECSLCDEAKEALVRVRARVPFDLHEVDIRSDPAVFERYRYEIPVIFVEGREAFRYRVDEQTLLAILGR